MFDVKSLVRGSGPQVTGQRDGPLTAGSLTSIEQPKRPVGRPAGVQKRPSNMKRELYNILVTQNREGKDISSMMPSNVHDMYKNPKANMGKRRVRKYQWVPFTNQARSDGLQLHHWERADKNQEEAYCFAKWNKVVNIPTYTDDIYKKHLQATKWTREETDLLFEMCRRFDLRWQVVQDRYETGRLLLTEKSKRDKTDKTFEKRTIEDLKERFYAVLSEVNVLNGLEPVAYDAEHERRRKEQLRKQLERTHEDMEEEERLVEDLKRIEARRKERERKAQDLQKLINMEQHSPSVSGAHSPAPGKKKFIKSKLSGAPGAMPNIAVADIPALSQLRFTEYKSAGSHLRSQEMKLPTNVGQKKLKNIETILEKLKLEMNPMGSNEIVSAYNDFRSNIILLQELKQALQTAEFDLEGVRTRLLHQGAPVFDLEPRMRISTLPDGGYDPSSLEGEGAPGSLRRITSWLDINQPAGIINPRKRKLTQIPPSPMELKKSRKS